MMITIHGLPPRTTFQAVKALVKQECNIIDFILDNLVDDGPNSKKVRIGVSDDTEGYRLMKCLDGFRMSPSHLLKIVPVGKSLNVPPQQNYDQRSGFSNQPRNDYPNQSRQDYQNQPMNDYANRGGPHGPRGSTDSRHPGPGGQGNQDSRHYGGPDQRHMDHGVPDSRGPLRTPEIRHHGPSDNRHQASQGSLDNRNPQGAQDPIRGQPWGPNVNSPNNQWGPQGPGGQVQSQNSYNQRPEAGFGSQHSQGSDHYAQGRGPPDQGYGFPSKTNVPERVAPARETRQHVLRSVEIVDSARPYQQEKPVIIMKDNFQGPSQYNTSGQQPQRGHFSAQERGPISAWAQPGQQNKPNLPYNDRRHPAVDKRPDMPEQMTQGYDKRDPFSPPRNRLVSPSRNIKPSNVSRNYQEPAVAFPVGDRRISPTRRLGPPVREFSPSGRRISPTGRRVSPPGRRISPNGRRVSPPGRRVSPPGRRVSPPGRRVSPTGRRLSPPGRRVSPPGRGGSPSDRRISPPGRKMSPGRRMSPGRNEPRRMSPNERRAGRRDSPRRFSPKRASPGATRRLASPPLRTSRFSPNLLGDKTVDKFMDDGKVLKPVRPAYEPAQAQNQTYTGGYRDSAPYGGRPEPWAEKIMYPSKKDDERRDMARRPDIGMEKSPSRLSRSPRRERSPLKERYRRHSPSPRSSRSPRRSWALEKRSSPEPIREPPPPPIWPGQDPDKRKRFEESKRDPVWEMPDRRSEEPRPFESKLRVRTDLENKFAAARPSPRDDDDRPKFSRESPRRDEKKPFSDIDKDFQDIYKRAVEFRKKTEERKSGERRRDDYEDRYRPTAREDSPRRDRKDQKVEWNTQDRKRILLTPAIKSKRDKAVEEISNRIIDKYKISGDQRYRVMEELKVTLHNIFMEMFSNKDVSFIELVIKYQARYDAKEEEKLMHDVLSRLPSQYRNLKRKTDGDTSEVPSKTSRRSPQRNAREEARPKLSEAVIPDWNIGLEPPKVMAMSFTGINEMNPVMNLSNPVMVPPPVYVATHVNMQQHQAYQTQQQFQQMQQFGGNQMQQQFGSSPVIQQQFEANSLQQQQFRDSSMQQPHFDSAQESTGLYNLYLCQDDFEPFSEIQAEYLKNFLVNQIVKETENSNGWAPDITLKGLQSLYRYELCTKDELSKDWVLNLNFSEFEFFNVLVYTKEELWYERAAIWLPGHSRNRNIEPLDKLKMQNKRLDGVNLSKWKFVKKIVTTKGTRLYVDMPPSSARALEKHKMMLSYELQKVNVFLKAVAVDKDSFDAGLKEPSITDRSLLVSAVQNSPMPTLNANTEPGIVKIGVNGQKSLTVEQARKIKEVIVYFLFKYLQVEGLCSKTDFVKYGYCAPCYIGIVPENAESKRWLTSRNFGKLNRHNIVVLGIDDDNTKYFKMIAYIPHEYHTSTHLAFERLKQSNQGIKGIHFNLWKPVRITNDRKKALLELEVDLESVEVLSKMKYKLDYVGEFGIQVVDFKSEYSLTKLEEKIRKCKMEQVDSYDVANMDLDSDSEKEDVICLERNYVPSDRKHFTSRQYDADRRHGIGFKHSSRPTKRRAPERVITREAVLYGKTDALEDRPVKKTPQARPKTEPARTEPAPKIKAVEEKLAPASLEPTADGHYELSPLMSKLLEVELDDVMNKVAKATPNVMCSEAERIVVETFKNKAGEAMRNTIGLNVTKRLLNVHNPLYVKMVFSAKPARADLVSFLKKYNVSAFKRAGTHGGIFAAKMRNFQDFDQLCTSNDLSCGTVRVTVTPCYQFMTCPPNLRTRYTIKEVNKNSPKKNYDANIETANLTESQEVKPVQKETILQTDANKQSVTHKVTPTKPNQSETAKITDKPTPIAEKQNTATKVTPSKPAATSDQNASPKVTPAKPTVTNDQNTTDKAVPAKPAAANNSTTKVTPAAANNQKATPKVTPAAAKNQNDTPKVTPQTANNENATSKVTPAKPSAENTPKVTPAKPSAENTPKITPAKPSAENTPKVTPAKPSAENTPKITPAKPSAENTPKITPAKPSAENTPKITPAKPSAENTPKVTPATQTATLSKPAPNSKTATKPQPAKPVAVKTPAKPKPYQASNKAKVTPVKPTAGKKKHENDYDELDDHDILALISEGIVLDECSGSEDEV